MDYKYYSALAKTEQKNNEEQIKFISVVEDFDLYKSINDIKTFLQNKYNISGNINKYVIQQNCFLTIKESESQLVLKIEYQDEIKLYYYNK